MLALGGCARFGSVVRAAAAALTVALLVAGCAAGSGQGSGPGAAGADQAGSASSPSGTSCSPDEAMGRPCADGAPMADQSHRPRYKSDQGDAVEQYNGTTYHGQPSEYCKARLRESFPAYKACIRY